MQDENLDEAAVCKLIGGSKPINPSTLWRGVKSGRYSKPFHISDNAVRWKRAEILGDIDRMVAERDSGQAA